MKIRYVSDIHFEICPFVLPYDDEDEDESDQVLVLAGDIAVADRFNVNMYKFFQNVANRYRKVLYVPGNHEYYHGNMSNSLDNLRNELSGLANVHVLQEEILWVDAYAFIGATLWTDMNGGNQSAMNIVANGLNDYHIITSDGQSELKPQDTVVIHERHKKFIFDSIVKVKEEGAAKVIVISHHAPSHLSIHPKWAGHELNAAFSSNLFDDVRSEGPDLWFHGHMHDNFDYVIGNTRVICNPRGYSRIINASAFNSMWVAACDGISFKIDPYSYYNIFHQENVKFDPWASVEL